MNVGTYAVAPVAGRAVLALGDADVARAVEQPFDAHAGLGARQRCTGARVDAASERDVLAGVRPVDVERRRIVEAPWVAVGRGDEQHERRAGGNVDAAHRRSALATAGSRP